MPSAENRRDHRRSVMLDCQLEGESGIASSTRLSDLSTSGCYVDSRTATRVGSRATVRVTIAGVPLALSGRVVHVQRDYGFAIEFDPLSDNVRALIANLVGATS